MLVAPYDPNEEDPPNEATGFDDERYAGSFYVFGHWRCVGDEDTARFRPLRSTPPTGDRPTS